jgi:alpha-tubulin suppressor-like RCC1 family protein
LAGVVGVAAGYVHSLALKDDGTVWAWGPDFGPAPIRVSGFDGVAAIAAGGNQNLALKTDGTVWAWGANHFGQLGNGTTTDRSEPAQVGRLADVVAVAAGGFHGLALKRRHGLDLGWVEIFRVAPAQLPPSGRRRAR